MQRFFAVIELASSPFISAKGPAQFVSNNGAAFKAANNVKIFGPGVIGRSSHHGIHGNNNSNVTITGVTFRDFEVAAVAMNRINNLEIRDNFVSNNRHDVPVSSNSLLNNCPVTTQALTNSTFIYGPNLGGRNV